MTKKLPVYKMFFMDNLTKAREFFEKDRFATAQAGCKIIEVGDFYSKCSFKIEERHLNGMGHVMGGAIFTLADFSFAVASNFNNAEKVVSVTSQISFLASPKGTELFAESSLIKNGRSTCIFQVKVYDDTGTDVAFCTMTGMKLRNQNSAEKKSL